MSNKQRISITVYSAVRCNWQDAPAENEPVPMVLLSDHEKALDAAEQRENEACALELESEPDNYAVQNCCICYGGNSFPTLMKEALKCHAGILAKKIRARQRQRGKS